MSKKLTKTIILIVFVVFLGINKVEARVCRYQVSATDQTAVVSVEINDDGTLASVSGSGTMGEDKDNIDKLNNHPNWDDWGKTTSDSTYLVLTGSDTPSSNGLTSYKSIDCLCSGTSKSHHFSATLHIDANLSSPTINITSDLFTAGSYDRAIENWSSRPSYFSDNNNYVFALSYNNSCPNYLILAHSAGKAKLFVSDEANKNQMVTDVADKYWGRTVYAVSCSLAKDNSGASATRPSDNSSEGANGNSGESTPPPEISVNVGSLNTDLKTYSCGSGFLTNIPANIINLVHIFYNFLQFLVPIAIIILGTLDLLKAITSQKEDEIKKGQMTFFKRLIGAVLVFFVFAIIKLLVGVVSGNSQSVIECLDCFLKGESSGADAASCHEE